MSITASGSPKRELIPAGNYAARCYSMVEIGTITEPFMGEMKTSQRVMITWELPTEKRIFNPDKGEQPMVISQEFTLSLNEKSNLRKLLESWRGKGFTEHEAKAFDISKLIGVPGLMNIIHKVKQDGSMKQVIASITPMPKGLPMPKQINPSFELSYDNFEDEKFNLLPDFLKAKMRSSEEFKAIMNPNGKEMDDDEHFIKNGGPHEPIDESDDLPF